MRGKVSSRPSGFAWLSPDNVLQLFAVRREAAIHASVTGARRMAQQITIVAARSPIVAKNDF
jgi:hypothetical protein